MYADLSGVKPEPKPTKTFYSKFTKALEKKFVKTLVSIPSFALGFFANTPTFKNFLLSIF